MPEGKIMKSHKIILDTHKLLGFRLAEMSDARTSSRLETKVSSKTVNLPASKVGKDNKMPSAMVGKPRENIPPAMVGKVGKPPTN